MARLREKSAPTAPSTHLKDIDPLVERVMLRCLEKNPDKRPAFALQVSAALPGGDPLAAALAAGETPSPEMVAAAGEKIGLRPAIAWGCLLAVVLGLAAAAVLSQKMQLPNLVPLPSSPEALAARARDLARDFGYAAIPVDTAYVFDWDSDYFDYITKHGPGLTRWNYLSSGVPPSVVFWYRESPQFMATTDSSTPDPLLGRDDPPNSISGMCRIVLDPQGHLVKLEAVPPQLDTSTETAIPPNWRILFAAAGLDPGAFKDALPQWTPLAATDARAAWEGTWPGHPELALRVEAAAYRGKPVYFNLVSPWTKPDRTPQDQTSTSETIINVISLVMFFSIVLVGIVMARSNVQSGRSDRRGAARLALLAFLLIWASVFLRAHHIPTLSEFVIFLMATQCALIYGAFSWLLYVALEPHVRRRWPSSLISWSRLLAGQLWDPVVGRDVLVGILAGVLYAVQTDAALLIPGWMGMPALPPSSDLAYSRFDGIRLTIGSLLGSFTAGVALSFAIFIVFFLVRLLLRKGWLAALMSISLFSLLGLIGDHPVLGIAEGALFCSLIVILLLRFGPLALAVALWTNTTLQLTPLTTHLSAWYAEPTFFVFFVFLAVAIFGFYTSTVGKPRLGGFSLET